MDKEQVAFALHNNDILSFSNIFKASVIDTLSADSEISDKMTNINKFLNLLTVNILPIF